MWPDPPALLVKRLRQRAAPNNLKRRLDLRTLPQPLQGLPSLASLPIASIGLKKESRLWMLSILPSGRPALIRVSEQLAT